MLQMPQLGYAVAELGRRVGVHISPTIHSSEVASQLNQIAKALDLGFNINAPFPSGLLNAIYYWLKSHYERQLANVR